VATSDRAAPAPEGRRRQGARIDRPGVQPATARVCTGAPAVRAQRQDLERRLRSPGPAGTCREKTGVLDWTAIADNSSPGIRIEEACELSHHSLARHPARRQRTDPMRRSPRPRTDTRKNGLPGDHGLSWRRPGLGIHRIREPPARVACVDAYDLTRESGTRPCRCVPAPADRRCHLLDRPPRSGVDSAGQSRQQHRCDGS